MNKGHVLEPSTIGEDEQPAVMPPTGQTLSANTVNNHQVIHTETSGTGTAVEDQQKPENKIFLTETGGKQNGKK